MEQILKWMLAVLLVVLVGCESKSDDQSQEQKALSQCMRVAQTGCEKACECSLCFVFGVQDASGCKAAATEECSEDDEEEDGGDACEPPLPSDSLVDSCVDQIENTQCESLDSIFEKGSCQQLEDLVDECQDEEDQEEENNQDPDGGQTQDGSTQDGSDQTTDQGSVTIHTEGCEAAVVAMCGAANDCKTSYPNLGPVIDAQLAACELTVSQNQTTIQQACQDYLEAQVPLGDPLAVWLNVADATQAQTCVASVPCDKDFILEVLAALATFSSSGSTDDLEAILVIIVTQDCL